MKRRPTEVECSAKGVVWKVVGLYYPGAPGRFSGPPEDCYPDDPDEYEIEAVYVDGIEDVDFLPLINEDTFLAISEAAYDAAARMFMDTQAAELDDYYDRERDQ